MHASLCFRGKILCEIYLCEIYVGRFPNENYKTTICAVSFVCIRRFSSQCRSKIKALSMDVKDFLHAWCGTNKYGRPGYDYKEANQPVTVLKRFSATVTVKLQDDDVVSGLGFGSNNKIARTEAANNLCENLVQRRLMGAEEVIYYMFLTSNFRF